MSAAPSASTMAPYEMASATLLAQQPVSLPANNNKPDFDWDLTFSHLESRLAMMRNWRYSWWVYWAKLAEYILPRRYHWLITANLFRKGNPINQAIIDGTAGLAKDICAAGMVDGLMPTTRKWFKLGIGTPNANLDAAAKEWFEDTEARLETVLAQSNFYNIMAQAAQDLVVFGTAPVIMYEDYDDVIRCYSPCAGEYYLAVGSRFSVDTLYREFTLTVAQIVEMFTLEACPSEVRGLWETGGGSLEIEMVVAHAVEPNFPLDGRGGNVGKDIPVVKGNFVYREIYWLKSRKSNAPLSKRGFNEKPFAVARWATTSNDPYGRGPGMDALGDVMQLQQETRRKAEAIEKQVRPPMGADPEMKNEPSSILPGHVTYVNSVGGKKGFWPLYEVKPDLQSMTADLKEIQSRIDRYFLVDVFMAISQMDGIQPRNDLEIAERKGEKLQRLGPVIGLWKTEFAGPLIERAIGILKRRNLLKPLPKSLAGVPFKIDYIDMVTLAQQGSETAGMERTFQVMGNLSAGAISAGLPNPLRIFNLDESSRIYADKVNFPNEGIYTDKQVMQHDQIRAKAQQAAQAQQQAMAAAQGAATLSKTDVGGGQNALQLMLGSGANAGGGGAAGGIQQ